MKHLKQRERFCFRCFFIVKGHGSLYVEGVKYELQQGDFFLSIDDIRHIVDDLIEAHGDYLPEYH